ncbi:MAG: hypothetical protein JWR16_1980, partial [Nevskia sp.]|nr:hypothetical protein [Nevskia sp.]
MLVSRLTMAALFSAASLATVCVFAAPSSGSLQTVAELSGYKKTGRYDEVVRLC